MTAAVSDTNAPQAGGDQRSSRRILDNLPSGARTTGEQAAARSRLVRRLRLALPILGVILVSAFFFNTRSTKVDPVFLDEFKDMTATTDDLLMANPRFAGVDDKGKPFEITAKTAKQQPGQRNIVELENPRAVQGLEEDMSVVVADKGVYSSEENVLELSDSVTFEHQIGGDTYVLKSPAATVSIKSETVTSDAGVGGTGPDGATLQADHMTAYRGDRRVVFEGNVSMRIYPKSAEKIKNDKEGDDTSPSEENGDE